MKYVTCMLYPCNSYSLYMLFMVFCVDWKYLCNPRRFYLKMNSWIIIQIFLSFKTFRALFTKFLTPGLIHELCNPLDDWLDWLIPTDDRSGYIIRRLIRELKVWWIRASYWFIFNSQHPVTYCQILNLVFHL